MTPLDLRQYVTGSGRVPFQEWRRALRDTTTRQRVDARLARVRSGNLGDYRDLGQGLSELRLDFGAGYRIYFCQDGATVVVLLAGGDKGSQARDIAHARAYLQDYWHRRNP